MNPTKPPEASRKKAWQATKKAVADYARNPCRATEIKVEAALDEVKRACSPCPPESNRPARRKRQDKGD